MRSNVGLQGNVVTPGSEFENPAALLQQARFGPLHLLQVPLLSLNESPWIPHCMHLGRPDVLESARTLALMFCLQVVSLTPEQINSLPPDQRDQIAQLRQQLLTLNPNLAGQALVPPRQTAPPMPSNGPPFRGY